MTAGLIGQVYCILTAEIPAPVFYCGTGPTMLRWGSVAWLCWFAVGFLKLWTWMEMERFAVVREIKRLELQVANLSARLREEE